MYYRVTYLRIVLLGGIVEFNLKQDGVFAPLNTVLLEVTNGHRIGIELRGKAVALG